MVNGGWSARKPKEKEQENKKNTEGKI